MAAPPLELQGKSNPMTVFSAVPVWLRWPFWLMLWVFKKITTLGIVKDIMFIHFACWHPVNRNQWPRPKQWPVPHKDDEQPEEDLNDDYYLFTTNFNGPWDQYIDAFGLIKGVRYGLDYLWITSRGFPTSWPMRPFKRYIHYYEYQLHYYYNAYPGMSVRDVRAARELNQALDDFIEKSKKFGSAQEFQLQYDLFVDRVASHMGYTGSATEVHMKKSFFGSSRRPQGLQA